MRTWRVLVFGATAAACAVAWWGCGGDEFTPTTGGAGTGAGGAGGAGGGTGGTGATGGNGGGGGVQCVDADLDGTTDCAGDCDDNDPTVHPGAPEICGDGVDNDCNAEIDPPAMCNGIGTYVSSIIGDDANPGTQTEPVKTILEGMNKAVQLGLIQPVFVGEGTYPEDVTLQEGVDLLGGHQCAATGNCTWQRDPSQYVSTIESQDADGIYAGHGITRETLVDGFTVQGLSGNPVNTQYSAFFIQGAPEIRNNQILAGDVTGCTGPCGTRGITVSGAPTGAVGALIAGNTIEGGDSSSNTLGIEITSSGVAEISGNEITGGVGTWTRGISVTATAGAVSIERNAVHAGSCAGNNTSFGIYVGQGVGPLINANRINADPAKVGTCPGFTGNWWTGGIESEGSTAIMTNNIIAGMPSPRSTAVLLADCEGTCQIGQVVLNANTLDAGGATSAGNQSISAAVVFKTWKSGQNVVVGRIRNNILLGGSGMQSYAGYEDVTVQGSTCKPEVFEYNNLYGATTLYSLWDGTNTMPQTTIMNVNGSVNGAGNNISTDPKIDGTFHLLMGSPCQDAGTESGGETPAKDIDGDARPMGVAVDIGADEAG